jgi:hypothetical protein
MDPSLKGFLRGKLSSAKSSSELKAAGQLIQNLKEEGKLPSAELDSLRTLYRAQATAINAKRAAAKVGDVVPFAFLHSLSLTHTHTLSLVTPLSLNFLSRSFSSCYSMLHCSTLFCSVLSVLSVLNPFFMTAVLLAAVLSHLSLILIFLHFPFFDFTLTLAFFLSPSARARWGNGLSVAGEGTLGQRACTRTVA